MDVIGEKEIVDYVCLGGVTCSARRETLRLSMWRICEHPTELTQIQLNAHRSRVSQSANIMTSSPSLIANQNMHQFYRASLLAKGLLFMSSTVQAQAPTAPWGSAAGVPMSTRPCCSLLCRPHISFLHNQTMLEVAPTAPSGCRARH